MADYCLGTRVDEGVAGTERARPALAGQRDGLGSASRASQGGRPDILSITIRALLCGCRRVGRRCVGRRCVGRRCVGRRCVGRRCVGRRCVGHHCRALSRVA
ncbi:hypothetical protein C0Z19_12720 [Trinickia soli]|uniref:Uncharacterized protein n=1 Tax=Trinickia soli TaxID=380675 RepID=A0A2N7W5K6_9BURK|nr:hypothetical protein C0Z19_12720 [Trinickia soli]